MNTKKNKKTLLVLITLGVMIIASMVFFAQRNNGEVINDEESIDIPFQKQGKLAFLSSTTGDTLTAIDIEVADNDQKRARGLMFRKGLPENAGMLFVHTTEDIQSFWMKNTYIALDMIFVNSQKEIVTIQANTTPLREWSYASTQPALYVVEVNAGFCNRHKISEGDKIEFTIK